MGTTSNSTVKSSGNKQTILRPIQRARNKSAVEKDRNGGTMTRNRTYPETVILEMTPAGTLQEARSRGVVYVKKKSKKPSIGFELA